MAFEYFAQHDKNDCGPASLKMIANFYGKEITITRLRNLCHIKREGVSLLGIQKAAIKLGFDSVVVKSVFENNLVHNNLELPIFFDLPLPNIVHWKNSHFIVVYKIKNNSIYVADPARGKLILSVNEFKESVCLPDSYAKVILFEPTKVFNSKLIDTEESKGLKHELKYLLYQIKVSKGGFYALIFLVLIKLLIQVLTPLLTQFTFDSVIIAKSINLLIVISIIQFLIFIVNSLLGYFESRITHRISLKINFSMTNQFIRKLFSVPILSIQGNDSSDFIQRTNDLAKIESFLTYNLTSIVLSILTFISLVGILLYKDTIIFGIYLVFAFIYIIWIKYSLNKRKRLDPEKFDVQVKHHNQLQEIIEGIQEIKINGSENLKISKIIENQKKYYDNKLSDVKLTQLLTIGSGFITNISFSIISIYSMYLTILNKISIGEMAAIQLIILQLNSNLTSISSSSNFVQEIKFSLQRVLEIDSLKDENIGNEIKYKISTIEFRNVSFSYSEMSPAVLKNLNFEIKSGTTTAIVGLSGGGKSTLMKLILGLYNISSGEILIDGKDRNNINLTEFRKKCGIVLQDGYIFTDSIVNNISGFEENPDIDKYVKSIDAARMTEFINSLPLNKDTLIGNGGVALSTGQKQRLLISKLIYKDPEFIFLDEATNSLDSETEKIIIDNMNSLFGNRTKIIIAHRLNTIINADQILVLNGGEIAERGTHKELLISNGQYTKLFKEQLLTNS